PDQAANFLGHPPDERSHEHPPADWWIPGPFGVEANDQTISHVETARHIEDLIGDDTVDVASRVIDYAVPEPVEPRGQRLVITHPGPHGERVPRQDRADLRIQAVRRVSIAEGIRGKQVGSILP